jgi:ABC-type nitrate/sulfonate/bicarbonate transport system substrate-binding protein
LPIRKPLRTVGIAVIAIALALGASSCSSSKPKASSSTTVAAGSGALTQVKIGGSTGGDFALLWIAEQGGFFKAQGLDAKFVNFVGAGAPAITSAFLGGSFDFLNGAVASTMSAKAAGAPMQAIFGVDIGQQIEIAVHNTVAQKLNMPQPDGTAATALKQFQALKGSHIKIGVTSTTSPAYNAKL